MTEEEFRSYRFSSGEEPSDEMLERLMKNAAEEAARTNREMYERFFDELNKQAAEIHRRHKKELETAQNLGKTNQKTPDNYMEKTKIENKEYGGERPLFAAHDLELEHVIINPGESALKATRDIVARRCEFRGKYPFWHARNFEVEDCYFTEGARAALWYSQDCVMRNCRVEAPKMFRELKGLYVSGVEFPNAQETLWHCSDVTLEDVKMFNADYLFMHTDHVVIDRYEQHGNYSFQYCHDVVIRNAKIYSKDALWNTVGVTVRDSELHGEYLGWYSHGLRLVNCHITGTQPLCYCHDLVLENCTFGEDADLAFEDSDVRAGLHGHVTSIKNPRHGYIYCDSVGEVILDENIQSPADCRIVTTGSVDA